jgi:hypothetical protein
MSGGKSLHDNMTECEPAVRLEMLIGHVAKQLPQVADLKIKLRSNASTATKAQLESIEHILFLLWEQVKEIREILAGRKFDLCEEITQAAGKLLADERSNLGKLGAAARHKLDREKSESIRSIWAQGNYKTRFLCAKGEHTELGMALDTARRALNRTPNPDPWPAEQKPKIKEADQK